ncbi:hypothetical protein DFH06DRAFT_1332130 [Mycena polygramma]|nr:hypothetical protein DFH06DRAFT_1332130 [Mycena polygramma]
MEWMLALTTEEGSRRLVWAAVGLPAAPDTLRGQYINCCEVLEPSDFVVQRRKVEQGVWNETMSILAQLDARIRPTAQKYLASSNTVV